MSSLKEYPKSQRPTILLFSEANCLAVYLVEDLLANHCLIKVFAEDVKSWATKTEHLQTKDFVVFEKRIVHRKIKEAKDAGGGDYALFVNFENTNIAIDYSVKTQIKTLVILPYRNISDFDSRLELPDTLGLVFVGDLIGPRIDLVDSNPIAKILIGVYKNKKLSLSGKETLYPVYVGDVSRLITKWLFSFGPYGEATSTLSQEIPALKIANDFSRYMQGTDMRVSGLSEEIPDGGGGNTTISRWAKRINIKTDLDKIIKATVEWFLKQGKNNIEIKKTNKRFPPLKKTALALFILTFMLIFPVLISLTSLFSLYQAKRFVGGGSISTAKRFLEMSATTSQLAEGQFIFYSKIPLMGKMYTPGVNVARMLNSISSMGKESALLLNEGSILVKNVFEGNDFDVFSYSKKLVLRLNSIYESLAFLEGEMNAANGYWEKLASNKIRSYGLNDFGGIKNLILSAKIVLDRLPDILGAESKKTYLVLLQNNMELRPTGGFIGSFALVTLDKGKISDITIQDVYSADGQLKGYIKPPDPIRDYLNEANWFLRDSNWDPDFPTSASRAEWFLDKEIDVSVDGVISVDLEPVKDFLGVYGPLLLSDYNVTLDENNFYEKTQAEAEKEFFPGSYRKSGFLTAISRDLTGKLANLNEEKSLNLLKIFYENLNQKHIQIFLHDKKVQSVISDLGWDGSVNHPECSGNCFSDWFGLVEANLGVNKSNYYIKRSYSLAVLLQEGMIVKKSFIAKYNNRANPELGPKAIYKTYTRLLVSPDAEIGGVYLVNGESKEALLFDTELVSGRKEIGFIMEIPPGSERLLYMDWTNRTGLSKDSEGQYGILWRKQSGVGDDPIQINFNFGSVGDYRLEQDRSLTFGGQDGYNALLSRDVVSRIFW